MKSLSSLESTGETELLDLDDGVNNASGPENDDDEGEDEEDDMGDVEDEEDEEDEEAEDDPSSGGSIGDAGGYNTRAAQPSVRPLVPANGRNMAKGRAAAEDFPLPPSFGSGHVPVGQTQMQAQQLQAQQAQTLQMHHADTLKHKHKRAQRSSRRLNHHRPLPTTKIDERSRDLSSFLPGTGRVRNAQLAVPLQPLLFLIHVLDGLLPVPIPIPSGDYGDVIPRLPRPPLTRHRPALYSYLCITVLHTT
jgi:hypothetical protein